MWLVITVAQVKENHDGWWGVSEFFLHRINTWRGRTLAIVCSRRVCGCPQNRENGAIVTRTNTVHDRPRPFGRETESGMEAVP